MNKSDLMKLLRSRGVPGYLFRERPINPDKHLTGLVIEGRRIKSYRKETQKKWLDSLMEDPFTGHVMCIGSEPNDLKAKLTALRILAATFTTRPAASGDCRWVTFLGGFENRFDQEPLRSKGYKLLALTNVLPTSTPSKKEKLRDVLEEQSEATKIVVTIGNPVQFINDLGFHAHKLLYLTENSGI